VPRSEPQTDSLVVGEGADARKISVRHTAAGASGATGLFWLPGFMSDMSATKATAVAQWALMHGLGATLFDYSGHGISEGLFIDGTIGRWLEEAAAVFVSATAGPQVIIGSSMGGHIALLLVRKLARENPEYATLIKGLVLIAPAWDLTEELMWNKFSAEARAAISQDGAYLSPSVYAQPYTITQRLIEDGRNNLLARQPFDPGCPVIILQGLLDEAVPPEHTRELLTFLNGQDVRLVEIADGEHRLSRPEDLEKLYAAIEALV
jgi:alpha-beta hydrolase superfamily lysophospholipase